MQARKVRELLMLSAEYLERQGCEAPRLDAEVLLGHVLGLSRVQLYVNLERPLNTDEVDSYRKVISMRARRIPVPYITGEREFYSTRFVVNENVLIPRPETELLVDKAIELAREFTNPRVLDIGTGSGAIALSVAKAVPEAEVTAVDISGAALEVAELNARELELDSPRIQFLQSDLFSDVPQKPFDLICSNPPYIPSREIANLSPEVNFEPRSALDGGGDGLGFYRRIIADGKDYLATGGYIIMEIGWDQASDIARCAAEHGLTWLEKIPDYAGKDRVVVLKCP